MNSEVAQRMRELGISLKDIGFVFGVCDRTVSKYTTLPVSIPKYKKKRKPGAGDISRLIKSV